MPNSYFNSELAYIWVFSGFCYFGQLGAIFPYLVTSVQACLVVHRCMNYNLNEAKYFYPGQVLPRLACYGTLSGSIKSVTMPEKSLLVFSLKNSGADARWGCFFPSPKDGEATLIEFKVF